MKHTFKKLPGSKIEVEVSLDQKEFLPHYQAAYEAALKGINLKGFRPGAAPKEMADAAVDKEAVFNEAARNAVRVSLDEISKDREWTLIDTPSVQIEDSKDLGIVYKATLTVFPEVKLPDYKRIAKKVMAEEKEQKVEEKEINETLEWIRKERKQGEVIPEVTDEWAKTLGKFENVEQLKKSISEGIMAEKKVREHDRLRLKILDEVVKESAIDLPEVMIEKTRENMTKQYGPMLKASGKSEDEAKKMLHEKAKNNVESNLVIYRIAQAEKLEPTEEQVKKQQGSVESETNYQYIYGVLQNENVFQFLEKQK